MPILLAAIHSTTKRDYPMAELMPLPHNIDQNESTRFSPQRHRDLNGTILAANQLFQQQQPQQSIDITVDQSRSAHDPHVGPYDCQGAVSLSASMQSNVPSPFGGLNKFTHLNMPGGQYGQGIRLMASDQQQTHYYTQLRQQTRQDWATYDQNATVASKATSSTGRIRGESSTIACTLPNALTNNSWHVLTTAQSVACFLRTSKPNATAAAIGMNDLNGRQRRDFATQSSAAADGKKVTEAAAKPNEEAATATKTVVLSRGERLKKAVKEYGSTVIVFHVGISLLSLGTCYALVSRCVFACFLCCLLN